jgi:hypothetical protein
MSGMQGMGGMARMIADKLRGGDQGGQPPMPGGPPPGPSGMSVMPNTNAGPHQGTPMQGMHRPQQQGGMAGLGQGMRAMYDKARVNALRGGQQ